MKNYLQSNYSEGLSGRQIPRQDLRNMMDEAWESISPIDLDTLINSMAARCQAVIDADGGYASY